MSMYKTIFWSEAYEDYASGEQVSSVSGEVLVFGESAFASLDEAVAYANGTLGGNAIVVKVASGKYDSYTVVNNGVVTEGAKQVMAVDFGGGNFSYDNGEYSREVTMEAAGFTAEEQSAIVDALNANAADGVVYVAGKVAGNAVSTIYVGSTESFKDLGDFSGISETVDKDNQIKNDEAFVIVDKDSSIGEVIGSIEHEAGHLMGESHEVTDGTIKDFAQTDADLSKFYVNPAYAALATGTAIEGMTGVYAGINAFDTIAKATAAATPETKDIYVAGEFANTQINTSRTLTVAADTSYTQNSSYFRFWAGDLVVKGNMSLSNLSQYQFGTSTSAADVKAALTVDGTSAAEDNNNGKFAINHKLTIYKDAAVEVINGGSFSSVGVTNYGSITADKSTLELAGNSESVTDNKGTIEALAGSTLNTGHVTNTGTITVDESTWNFEKVTDRFDSGLTENNGTINVSDSIINGGTIDNKGTINVSGESTLNIGSASGKAVEFTDGAVITSTTGANFSDATHSIGGVTFGSGKFNFAGAAMAYDKLALNAGADVTAAQTFAVYDDATIADGASVSANSVYVNGGDVTLEGDLTAKGTDGGLLLRNSNKSFNVDGGNVDVAYIEGTRGTVAVNLTDATVNGGHHITDNGGTLNWNIDNSSVSARTWTGAGEINVNNGEIAVTDTLTNNGTVNVAGESTLNIGTLTGNVINVLAGATLTDSVIGGEGEVALVGNATVKDSDIYCIGGMEGTDGNVTMNISGTEADQVIGVGYADPNELNGNLQINLKDTNVGVMTAGSRTFNGNVEFNVTEGSDVNLLYTGLAATFANGVSVNVSDSEVGNLSVSNAVNLTGGEYNIALDNATVGTFEYGNGIKANEINIAGTTEITNALFGAETINVAAGSTLTAGSVAIAEGDQMNLTGSALTTSALTNNGTVNVSGESTLNVNNLTGSGKLVLGAADKATDISGTANVAVETEIASGAEVTLSGNYTSSKMLVGAPKYANDGVEGFDLTIAENANAAFSAMYVSGTSKLNVDGTLDAGGTLNVYGANFAVSDKGTITAETANITGNAEIKGDANFTFLKVGQAMDSANYQSGKVVFDGGNWESSLGNIYVGAAYVKDDADDPRKFAAMTADGNANAALVLKNDASIVLKENNELRGVVDVKQNGLVELSDNSTLSVQNINNAGTISATDSYLKTGTLTNNGTVTVGGESTLDIAAVAAGSNDIELSEGTILKDSTIMGDVGITGNVTFRGKNVLNNMYDFGEYGAYGNTDWAKWTVEAGSQLFLEQTVTDLGNNLYGVGYGDTVVINGELTDADAARAAGLTKDDASFYSRTGVRFSSGAGWATSSFTVNNAYVILGTDGSFSNSAGNGGSHEITFNNAVVDAAQFFFSDSSATFNMSITDSNIQSAIFMTADKDSVYTLTGSKVVTTGSGNDRYNGNAGALTVTDSEITVQTGSYKNSGTITFTDSTLTAASIANTGTIDLTVTDDKLASLGNDAYYIINQTGNGADLGLTFSYNGEEYDAGDQITVGDIVYTVTSGDGNDLAIEAASKILTVNSSYTKDTPGFGFSKFNKFEDALQAASSEATAIKLESDVTVDSEIGYYNLPADLSIVADENVTLDMAGASFYPMGKKTLVVGENVEIANMGQMIAYESQVILNGDFAGAHLWTFGWNGDAENGATGLTINETSKVKVATQLEFRGGDVTINGNITDTSAALGDADQIQLLGTTYGSWGGASGYATKVNLNDTYIKLAQNTIGGAATKFQDGSSAIVTMDNSIYETAAEGAFNVASTGLVKAENGSIIYINSGVRASNAGTINITDSTFESKSAFANSGTINVSGESTLKIDKLTGEAIEINDGATITDSSVNGAVNLVSGTINLAGENAFTGGILSAGYYNYTDDLTVNITGDFTASNMLAWGGNANKTTVNVGAADGDRTAFYSEQLGTFYGDTNLNISNTDVEYGYMFIQGNLNVSDSTLQIIGSGINTYFKTGSSDHRIVIDNTTWNSGAYTDMGSYSGSVAGGSAIVDIKNGSTFNAGNFTLTTTEGTNHVVDLTVDNSTLNATTAFKVGAGTSATFENGAVLNAAAITNEGYFKIGENATATVGSIVMDGNGMLDVWGQEGNIATLKAGNITATGADSGFYSSYGDTTVDGTIELQGSFSIGESTLKADTFKNISGGYQQELRNVDLDVTNFINGVGTSDTYATVSGTSKIQIDNLSGYYALRLADDTTLKGGTNIVGTTSVRALGDVTFGETETDFIHIDSFDNNNAAGNTMTVNGTLDISSTGKGFSTYWLGVNGGANATTLTGNGTINSNTAAILQYGKIVVDEGLTLNVTDQYAADLRFTLTDITIKGEINSIGNNNKLNAIQTSTVTVTGENAALNVDSYLLVGYQTYKGSNDTTDTYKSTVTVEDGAALNVDGTLYINKSSSIMVDQDSTFSAGSIINYGGMINSTTEGEIVLNQDLTTGSITTDTLTLVQGVALSADSISVNNLNLAIGSELTLGSGNSSVAADHITVTGKLVPENAEFTLVASGWVGALAGKNVWYDVNADGTIADDEKFTVQTGIENLTGLNFVTKDGNLYVKDFGAETTGIYIGDLSGAVDGKITTPDGATYTVGENAFATVEEAKTELGDQVSDVTTIALKSDDDIDAAIKAMPSVETVTIEDYAVIDVNGGDLIIRNDGHLDTTITAADSMEITNTSVNTLLGTYSADVEINVNNAGGMIGTGTYGVEESTKFNTSTLTVNDGDAANVEVNADALELNDTNTFGLNANSGILSGGAWGSGYITLNGSANMSIDGDINDTDVNIDSDLEDHTGTLTLNGNQTFSGDISANKIVVADGKVVTFDQNTVDFNELNVEGTLNADFTAMASNSDAGALTGAGTLNTTHTGAWIVNDSVTRDVSGFTGTVTMAEAGASIILGNGDFDSAASAEDSYFSADATVTVNGDQKVVLAGDGVNTATTYTGNGTINVGEYDGAFAEQSEDFNQTLSGANTGFTGTVNVSEGAQLKIENALGADSINMDNETTQSATDVATEFDTQLILNQAGLDLAAQVTGDANDIIDVAQNATLSTAEALNYFEGTVKVNANTLSIDGANKTAAKFTGTGIIDANADQILTADGAINDFSGTVDLGSSKLTLDGTNNTDAIFKSESTSAHLILNADQTFNATGALDQLESRIVLGGNDLTLNGENTFSSIITGTTDSNLNLNADLTLDRSGMALYQYEGTVNVNDNTLTVTGTENTKAKFTGSTDADISWYAGIMDSDGALDQFKGHITVGNELSINGINDTEATFGTDKKINIGAHNTFSTDGAINDVTGTIQLWGNTLTLEGENTTSATLKSNSTTAVLDADATQVFTGDVSGFSGTYDIAAGSSVTLSGTIADVINAQGNTLTLTNTTTKDITVNAGAGSDLDNLNFGGNNVALGAGDGDDFTNVIGEGNITDFGQDQEFGTVKAGTIYVTGSEDALIIDDLTADINITIDAAQEDGKSDVTIGNDDFAGSISVTLEDSDYLATSYKIATNGSFTSDTTITLTVGSNAAKTLKVDGREILDGESYLLKLKEETLILTKLPGYSNYVVVDGDWKEQEPYESVMDGTTERYIGYDAAHDLTDAVDYIKGYDKGVNANAGTNMGDATIELTEGKYTLADGKYLMNGTNEVTQLTMNGRDGETATLSGVVVASDGTKETTLNVNDVRIQGELYGGGNVVINNDADLRSSGNVIAAGAKDRDMANDSSLELNGGYFGNRVIAGGSVNIVKDTTITVDGNSSLVIDNESADEMVITGNVVGGSWAAEGTVVQNGTAEILVDVKNATKIRGNIFVNGGEGNGTLTVNGDSKITFTGDADLLTFTGTVNAINGTDTTEAVIFDNFEGEFNGSFAGFDVITIEGSTSLELGRRQNKTGDTSLAFVVNSYSANNDAMYIVRDANNWEFGKEIAITVDSTTVAGDYVLVDNYNGGFEDFTFTLNGQAYTLGDAVESNVIKVVDDQLILSVYDSNTNLVGNTTEQVVIDSTVAGKETQIVGDVVDNATTNSSAAVKITTDDAVISNTGTITGAETQKSVAIEIQSGTSDAVVDNSGTITAADVAKYNRAIYSEGKDLAVSNSGTINGEIYQNAYGAKSLDVENSGTITAMTSDMGSNSVISSSNGIINLTGDGGTYELAANTETGKFNGEIVEGQHGIAISASNTTFKAGTDVTVGNGTVKGLFNDSGKNIVISGDNNTIAIVGRRSAIGIEEYSYEGQSDVVISGDNNTISVTSASGATGIIGRNGAVVITGSGTEINVTSTGSYAYGIETQDVKGYSGDVIIGEFNADGSVAQASDIQITVDGQVSTNSNPVMAPIGVYAKKGTAQIALAEDGKIECESFTAVSAEKVQITNAGTIIGDVVATGSATDDAISMDVDAVLNGTVTGVDTLNVTGLEDVVAAGNVAGAKTIVGGVDDVLAGAATIDGETLTSGKVQLAGADDTVGTADDIWASLTKNSDGSLTVAWGRTETEMADALDAFKADNTLAIGDAVVATATTLDDSDTTNDFSKKENGKLA